MHQHKTEEVNAPQRLHPPSGRVGNEPWRVSGEGHWNAERASIHPPRRPLSTQHHARIGITITASSATPRLWMSMIPKRFAMDTPRTTTIAGFVAGAWQTFA